MLNPPQNPIETRLSSSLRIFVLSSIAVANMKEPHILHMKTARIWLSTDNDTPQRASKGYGCGMEFHIFKKYEKLFQHKKVHIFSRDFNLSNNYFLKLRLIPLYGYLLFGFIKEFLTAVMLFLEN